jgi:hypothetical protein
MYAFPPSEDRRRTASKVVDLPSSTSSDDAVQVLAQADARAGEESALSSTDFPLRIGLQTLCELCF